MNNKLIIGLVFPAYFVIVGLLFLLVRSEFNNRHLTTELAAERKKVVVLRLVIHSLVSRDVVLRDEPTTY